MPAYNPDAHKIGDVADQTGLSIRTLRHYEDCGLVTPSDHTPGGFRLYTDDDIARIQQIQRMKPLGFTLQEIREFLDAVDILHDRAGHDTKPPTAAHQAAARDVLRRFQEETTVRLADLHKQVQHADEFLAELNPLIDKLDENTLLPR